jgi:hypothetical protein
MKISNMEYIMLSMMKEGLAYMYCMNKWVKDLRCCNHGWVNRSDGILEYNLDVSISKEEVILETFLWEKTLGLAKWWIKNEVIVLEFDARKLRTV